jgi:lysophospholipase L1-like esterase
MPSLPCQHFQSLVRRCVIVLFCIGTATGALLLFWCNPSSPERPLSIEVTGDSVVIIHDTLTLRISVPAAAARGVRYSWFIDDPFLPDTTADTIMEKVFHVADTGTHFAVITAFDRDGIESRPDTFHFTVVYIRPTLMLIADTIGYVGVPFAVRIIAQKGVRPIDHYVWFLDNPQKAENTLDSTIALSWDLVDTGTHNLVACATDQDSLRSFPDSLPINVTYTRPRITPLPDTSIKINDSLALRLHAIDSLLPIESYTYKLDSMDPPQTVTDSAIQLFWRVADSGIHRLIVTAMNSARIASAPDTSFITVTCFHPQVRLIVDSTAAINDTCVFSMQANDSDGTIVEYRWSIDTSGWFTTQTSTLNRAFNKNAPGRHSIRALAIDNDGLLSDTASATIAISLFRPTAALRINDTTIYALDTLRCTADAFDTNGAIVGYQWLLDGQAIPQSTSSDSVTLLFAAAEEGTHHLICTAIDDDSLESIPDSAVIRVLPGTPVVTAMDDTLLSSLDSVLLTCTASDPNGSIVRYLWNTAGNGWNDSTSEPERWFTYAGQSPMRVLVAARDDDGLLGIDTVLVTFNRPPDSITLRKPLFPADTCYLSTAAPSHAITFDYESRDPDNDSVQYTVLWGNTPDTLVTAYEGPNRNVTFTIADAGIYFWRLDARDTWGHVRTLNGTFAAIKEYHICFIGHSLVTGYGGNEISGGFRGGVLDSLRTTLPAMTRLKAVGTVKTAHMSRSAVDDSSLAVDGIKAIDLALMFDTVVTTADIWVLLIGANGSFDINERSYTNLIMDMMISRDSSARIYVCNSPPLAASFTIHMANLPAFNQFIADSVAAKSSRGTHIFLVDAFTTLTTNGQYNPAWYNTDGLHPNQTGYNRLVDTIFTRMKESVPPAIPQE